MMEAMTEASVSLQLYKYVTEMNKFHCRCENPIPKEGVLDRCSRCSCAFKQKIGKLLCFCESLNYYRLMTSYKTYCYCKNCAKYVLCPNYNRELVLKVLNYYANE